MTAADRNRWLPAALAAAILAAAVGYLIGSGAAIGESEADRARDESYRTARDRAAAWTAAVTRKQGFAAGLKRGRAAGERVGMREAVAFGGGEAAVVATEDLVTAAQAEAAAAQSEIAARQANCGVVARAPGWCPTTDELAAYRAAIREARQAREAARPKGNGRDRE